MPFLPFMVNPESGGELCRPPAFKIVKPDYMPVMSYRVNPPPQ